MGASSEASDEPKLKHDFVAVSSKEVDTAAELGSGEGPVDPAEALRVRLVRSIQVLQYDANAIRVAEKSTSIFYL
jgi:hypothetical protein